MGTDCLYHIDDDELIAKLNRIGCDANTYDGVVNWFREQRDIIITVFPLFGEKIDYDTFKVKGYYYEVSPTSDGGVYLHFDSYDRFFDSYRYIGDGGDYIELKRRNEYPTYSEALCGAVCEVVKNYYWYSNNKFLDICRKHPNEERTEYPQYLALALYGDVFRVAFEFVSYDNMYTINRPVYRQWDGDKVHNYGHIQVIWDGKEFLVGECKDESIEGKMLWEIPRIFLADIEYSQLPEGQRTKEKRIELRRKYDDRGRDAHVQGE